MKPIIMIMACAALMLGACTGKQSADTAETQKAPMKIIFETDMGNDVDDALAYDMLMKYMEEGDIELLGISSNKPSESSVQFLDLLNNWYGYPDIPVGHVMNGATCDDAVDYAAAVVNMKDSVGNPLFLRNPSPKVIPSVQLYRELLAAQPDSSVTIVSVGFSTNLAQLLESPADSVSPLSGRDLVAAKVKRLVTMGGNMENKDFHEYNIVKDIPAAKVVFEQWPSEIVTSPWELGNFVLYPSTSIENDFAWATPAHPVVEAYKAYLPMPYDRPTWDLTSVLYAVEGPGNYFTVSEPGTFEVTEEGGTVFIPDAAGNRYYLKSDSTQMANIVSRFVELIPPAPKKYAAAK